MTELEAMAARLAATLPKRGGLTIFGDMFGGWDGVQTLVAAKAVEPEPGELVWPSLVLYGEEGETLTLVEPEGLEIGRPLVIAKASRVTWRWYWYGREPVTENLHVLDYRVEDGRIHLCETYSMPGFRQRHDIDPRAPAVTF